LWWVERCCSDIEEVHHKLSEFRKTSPNEFFAKDIATGNVIARVNEAGLPG
jgi:hypothetical protein